MEHKIKNRKPKGRRAGAWVTVVVFVLAVGGLCLASLLGKERSFSENENRYLAKFPELSVENVLDGSFQNGLEEYLNDQIWFRDGWITVKTAVQKACGDSDIGGAYIGKDGYDFEKLAPEAVDEKLLERNIKAVRKYFSFASEQGIAPDRLTFLMVPTSGLVMSDKLPAHARMFNQQECIRKVGEGLSDYHFIDACTSLSQARGASPDRQLYYRTDHHWTSDGAFAVLQQWAEETGRTVPAEADYQKRTVTERFRGSLYSKVLDYDSAWDAVWVYEREGAPKVRVLADKEERSSCYDESKLAEKDKYAYFFGGNYGEVQIRTGGKSGEADHNSLMMQKPEAAAAANAEMEIQKAEDTSAASAEMEIQKAETAAAASAATEIQKAEDTSAASAATEIQKAEAAAAASGNSENLLVVKDSFANAFVPLITEYFDNIYMIDLRYHRGDMKKYLEEHEITEVLFLYNISNFISDPNLFMLGR